MSERLWRKNDSVAMKLWMAFYWLIVAVVALAGIYWIYYLSELFSG